MKLFNRIVAVIFLLLALAHLFQRGSWLWVILFLYGALLCFFASLKKPMVLPYLVGLAAYAAYAIYLFFDKEGVYAWIRSTDADAIPNPAGTLAYRTREFCGVMFLVAVLLINMLWLRKQQKTLV